MASSYNIVMELFKEYDEYGTVTHYYINGEGAKIKVKPIQSTERKVSNGFHYYDETGYCSLCGRIDCRGGCFK